MKNQWKCIKNLIFVALLCFASTFWKNMRFERKCLKIAEKPKTKKFNFANEN